MFYRLLGVEASPLGEYQLQLLQLEVAGAIVVPDLKQSTDSTLTSLLECLLLG